MGFCESLVESIDYTGYIDDVICKLKNIDNKVYIFGASDRAKQLGKFMVEKNIDFEGFLINNEYYTKSEMVICGKREKIYIFENTNLENCILLLGIHKNKVNMKIFEDRGITEVIPVNIGTRNDHLIDAKTLLEHAEDFNYLYNNLSDDFSRACLEYCLKGRLTGEDYEFEYPNWTNSEYFFNEFMNWEDCKCVIDCGAYVGDTIDEFKIKRPDNCSDEYKIYAFEPDKDTYLKLKNNYDNDDRIIAINAATYSYDGKIGFDDGDETMSSVNCMVGSTIECRMIDSVVQNQKVDFIKMDVEGSELASLEGAKQCIKKDTPILAICIYHKLEDFWTIPRFIKNINNNYKLFIRPHISVPTELVLFAIC